MPGARRRSACRPLVLATLPVLVAALFPATPAGARSVPEGRRIQQANALCLKAERAIRAGNRTAAREAYEKALAAVPDYPDAQVGMGTLALGESRFEEALVAYRAALEGYRALGTALEALNYRRYTDAQERKNAVRAQILELVRPNSSTKLGEAQKRSRIAELETELRNLDAIEPPRPGEVRGPPPVIHFHIGNALVRLDRLSEALAEWEACAAGAPGFAPVFNNLAFAYWKQGRFDEARRSLERAEKLGFPVHPQFKEDVARASLSP